MPARARLVPTAALIGAISVLSACRPGGHTSAPPAAPSDIVSPPEPPSGPLAIATDPPPVAPAGPQITLTASDGTGLLLSALSTRAVLEGPLAFTEMHMTFTNPRPRTLEGTFKIALPGGASIGRFALRIGDDWQEGEVVERQRARVAYEDFLHRKQDPALLEQSAANEFSARVFPIPANGTKELTLSYTQEIQGAAPYVIPLKGLPQIGSIDASAAVVGSNAPLATLTRSEWAPDQDFVVDRSSLTVGDGLRSDDLVLARVRPVTERRPEPMASAVVLVDTSASRALGLDAEVRLLQRTAAAIARTSPDATWAVACFDQRVQEVFSGRVTTLDTAVATKVLDRGALGASDLGRALAWAGERAAQIHATRVLVMSDGVATAGATDRPKLAAAARSLASAGVERIDAIGVGGIRDDGNLHAIATAGLGHDGVVLSDADDSSTIARRLGEATRSDLAVNVEGASWWYPRRIDGAQVGDEFFVYAQVPSGGPVRITAGNAPAKAMQLRSAERPLLERAWVQAKVASLLDQEAGAEEPEATRREIVALSTSHRLLTPYTALLVLETEADYRRLGIDRASLADILAVQGSRVEPMHRRGPFVVTKQAGRPIVAPPVARKAAAEMAPPAGEPPAGLATAAPLASAAPATAPPPPAPREDIGEAFGAGGLGLSGIGSGGGAASTATSDSVGRGRLARAASPAARPAPVAVADGEARDEARAALAPEPKEAMVAPYTGRFADVMSALARRDAKTALAAARRWHADDPGDVMGLVALGETLEAAGDKTTAARAYGSIVDLFPARADMRRMAGERLERLDDPSAFDLVVDTYEKALAERPDHPSSHRLLAYALLKRHEFERAFEAALDGLAYRYPNGRFAGVEQVLRDDLGLIGAAWAHAEPDRRASILSRVRAAGGTIEDAPSVRFVLSWETDANDVDLHVTDASGDHAFYSHPSLASGGSLIADVTTGYGPECFTIRLPKARRSPRYTLQAHYYSRGPMGYGMGKLEVVEHDGHGGLTFSERPFTVMNDHAFVELGTY